MTAIYLDYNATTPVAPEVSEMIFQVLKENFGNPSSSHAPGREAKRLLEEARGRVASMIGAQPDEVFFTSGGSESNNWAIKGAAYALAETIFITVMHANNEVGTIEPIEDIGRIAREHGVLVHTDAAQSARKIAIDVKEMGADFPTIAGHKLYAPKGVGALYVKKGVKIEPLIHGAPQETGLRAGTENVAYNAGLGLACGLAKERLEGGSEKKSAGLRDRLHEGLKGILGERIALNGHPEKRLPNTLNLSFKGFSGADVLRSVPEILASTGAACHSDRVEPSAILLKMGISPEVAAGAVRFSAGAFTTGEEIERAIEIFSERFSR